MEEVRSEIDRRFTSKEIEIDRNGEECSIQLDRNESRLKENGEHFLQNSHDGKRPLTSSSCDAILLKNAKHGSFFLFHMICRKNVYHQLLMKLHVKRKESIKTSAQIQT